MRRSLAFLTIWPVPIAGDMAPGELGRAAAWFPVLGLAMGAALWGLAWLLSRGLPPLLVAALVVVFWAVLTGGLHLDGFADCCDGLFASAPPVRRLEILRDPGVGAFAAAGIALLLIAKTAAVASLVDGRGLLLAPALGRWVMLPLARGRAARPEGLGARLRAELTVWRMLPGGGVVLLASVLLGWRGLVALGLAHLTAWGWGRLAQARLGGHTGDVLGGSCELAELACLLPFAWV